MFWIPKTIAMSKATDWIKDIGPQHLFLALNCPDYKLGLNSDLGMLIAGAWFASLNASVRINQVDGAVLLLACCRNFVIVRSSPPDHSTKQLECWLGGNCQRVYRVSQKKCTFWIAILQNRIWGYVAFRCQLSRQLAVEGHITSNLACKTTIQKVRLFWDTLYIFSCDLWLQPLSIDIEHVVSMAACAKSH